MTEERFLQKDFKSMLALGRNFKVGDLCNYNYNDLILLPSGIRIVFITFPLHYFTVILIFILFLICVTFLNVYVFI